MSAQQSPATPSGMPRPQRPATVLELAGVSSDGLRLLLVAESGEPFEVDVDARLRAELRDRPARTGTSPEGQLEIKMESTLRPRDIQARIRAGETPESVAEAAQTTVEKVMPYAAPVLAEREHVAERAQRSSIRRPAGDPPGARTLGDAVAGRLRSLNVDPEHVTWDAWRREDGRWSLSAGFESTEHSGTAALTFDQPGNYVVLDNDDARWLVGEAVPGLGAVVGSALGDETPVRRLSAVPSEQLPFGEDAIELVSEADHPMEAFLGDDVVDPEPEPDPDIDQTAEHQLEEADHDDPAADEPPGRRPVKKSRGRASVPSWDEIMFGGPSE